VLLRCLLLQQWYRLSDPGLEEALSDRLSFRRFVGLALADPVPDHSTLSRFRSELVRRGLTERLLVELNRQLEQRGLMVKSGTLIDASLVEADCRRPRKGEPVAGRSDPDASWNAMPEKPLFGYKMHLAVDQGSGLVRQALLTPGHVSDKVPFLDLVQGDEQAEGGGARAGFGRPGDQGRGGGDRAQPDRADHADAGRGRWAAGGAVRRSGADPAAVRSGRTEKRTPRNGCSGARFMRKIIGGCGGRMPAPAPPGQGELWLLPRWLTFDEIEAGQRALVRYRGDPGLALDAGDPVFSYIVDLARSRREAAHHERN
jgi:IS5 family transposase